MEARSQPVRSWLREKELALLLLLVGCLYFIPLGVLPIVGEESRWASAGMEMLATGDWIVTRQQGQVFPERPPLGSWAMAAVGLVRGEVDVVAVRLPSVLAVLLMSLVLYVYARQFLSPLGAFASGAVYATFAQVMQIGRMGESEALFTFFLGSSLLLWHLGRVRSWPLAVTWSLGYGLAALAALVKGPQVPVYFVLVTNAHLLLRREWRAAFGWPQAVGAALFVILIGLWQVPYYLATDWASVQATWIGLAGDRFAASKLLSHLVTYPLETLRSLLPWSPLLLAFCRRSFRESLGQAAPLAGFVILACAVTYPTLWLATGARSRYFMPLYPCIAALIGLVIDRCAAARLESTERRAWRCSLLAYAVTAGVLGAAVLGLWQLPVESWQPLRPGTATAVAVLLGCGAAALVLFWGFRLGDLRRSLWAVLSFAGSVGLFYAGIVMQAQRATGNDIQPAVAAIRNGLPKNTRLVSFTAIDHRFAYYFQDLIPEHPWPASEAEVPSGTTYFCVEWHPGDTPELRLSGRGRIRYATKGTLPFAWEEVAHVTFDRRLKQGPQPQVIVGRIVPQVADRRLSRR